MNAASPLITINVFLRPNVVFIYLFIFFFFFGNLYTPEGVKPNAKKVEATKWMQPPINKQQLNSFLGMAT